MKTIRCWTMLHVLWVSVTQAFLVGSGSGRSLFISSIGTQSPPRSYRASASSSTSKSKQLYMSVPNPFDTLTSGMASLCRFPRGVDVIRPQVPPPTNNNDNISNNKETEKKRELRLLRLYNVENDCRCRTVRECLTELDLDVGMVISAAPNSRVWNTDNSKQYEKYDNDNTNNNGTGSSTNNISLQEQQRVLPRLVIQDEKGQEQVLVGDGSIVSYLTEWSKRTTEGSTKHREDEMFHNNPAVVVAQKLLLGMGGFLANVLRLGRGILVSEAATAVASASNNDDSVVVQKVVPRPTQPLILYSCENNHFCRLVREVLTELDLVYTLKSTGRGSKNQQDLARLTVDGGTASSAQLPFLIDPNNGAQVGQSADIIKYLYRTYALWTPPNELLQGISNIILPLFRPLLTLLTPIQAGSLTEDKQQYQKDIEAAKSQIEKDVSSDPVVVYTYELSPFSMEAKALLDNLNVPYEEISLGGEWLPGLIGEGGSQKRAALLEMTGQSSLPNIYINGKSIGGLFSGSPGIVPLLERGTFLSMVQEAMMLPSDGDALLAEVAEKMTTKPSPSSSSDFSQQLTKEKLQRAMKMTDLSSAVTTNDNGAVGADAFW